MDQIPGVMGNSMMEVRGGDISISIHDNEANIEIPIEASIDSSDWDHGHNKHHPSLTNDVEFLRWSLIKMSKISFILIMLVAFISEVNANPFLAKIRL